MPPGTQVRRVQGVSTSIRRPASAAAQVVEGGERGVRPCSIGGRDREHEGLDDHERDPVAREEAGRAATAAQGRVNSLVEFAVDGVGDQNDGKLQLGGPFNEDANVGLQPAVGEHDDRVAGREREQLVGERRARVNEGGTRLSDSPAQHLRVRREMSRGPDPAPHDAFAFGDHGDGRLKLFGRDIAAERIERAEVTIDRGREELLGRRVLQGAAQTLAQRRVGALGRHCPAEIREPAVSEGFRGADDGRIAGTQLGGQGRR